MNKKGLYFATLTIVILIIFVVSYNNYLIAKENDVALGKIGEVASNSIETFHEAERVKYYVNEAAKYSALKAIFLTGKNGGIYDSKDCSSIDFDKIKYIIWEDNCLPNKNDDFKSYFNGIFKEYLNNVNFNLENFDINIENNNIKGIASKRLELNIGSVSNVDVKYKIKEGDDKKVESGLERIQPYMEIIRKYSNQYNVPMSLVTAVIIQESNGDVNAVSKAGCYGLMQICPKPHPDYYNGRACKGENARDSVDCNIKGGVEILKGYYNQYSDRGVNYKCDRFCDEEGNCQDAVNRKYSGWSAALRAYNGLGCYGYPDFTYVEKILKWVNLLGGEIIQEFDIKKFGSYSFYPNFLINLDYDLDEYNKIKAIAENCLDKECVSMDYIIKKNKLENLIVFEFESREKLKDIEPVVIRFALPVET